MTLYGKLMQFDTVPLTKMNLTAALNEKKVERTQQNKNLMIYSWARLDGINIAQRRIGHIEKEKPGYSNEKAYILYENYIFNEKGGNRIGSH